MSKNYEDKGTLAEQRGLVAKRQDINKADDADMTGIQWGDVDPSSIARKGGEDVVTDVQAKELDANRTAVEARRKIDAILAEDSPHPHDLQQQYEMTGTISNPNQSTFDELAATVPWDQGDPFQAYTGDPRRDASFMGGMDQAMRGAGADLVQQGYRGDPNEGSLYVESMAGRPKPQTGSWRTDKRAAKLKAANKTIPIWQVIDERSGIEIPKKFRMQPPAERVATILNQTGNVNDPRISKIAECHDRYVLLLREMRKVRKLLNEGHDEFDGRLQELQFEAEEVGMILGI